MIQSEAVFRISSHKIGGERSTAITILSSQSGPLITVCTYSRGQYQKPLPSPKTPSLLPQAVHFCIGPKQ
ncbi:hypothetical protein BVRB_015300 [Beta vulgaris subsp. vulgaris]|uniref:Uncharacterized protein n=1 Tax=Beta vulgaris subsp. vulgaris TaxID=3555 RepID=A0A0J8B4K1_BETVV|nr:hypothetical protein BVRB_015300 [Beta vulgaris subsp. vulgaris]